MIICGDVVGVSRRQGSIPNRYVGIGRGIPRTGQFRPILLPERNKAVPQGPFISSRFQFGDNFGRRGGKLEPTVVVGSVGPATARVFIRRSVQGSKFGIGRTPVVGIGNLVSRRLEVIVDLVIKRHRKATPVSLVASMIIGNQVVPFPGG